MQKTTCIDNPLSGLPIRVSHRCRKHRGEGVGYSEYSGEGLRQCVGGGGMEEGAPKKKENIYYLYSSMYAEKYYFTGELEAFYRLR